MSGWEVLYPRRSGNWPGYAGEEPIRYDPSTKKLEAVNPERDRRLPQLADWLMLGELAGYRAGVRAAVSIKAGDRVWFAKVASASRLGRLKSSEDLVAVAAAHARETQLAEVPALEDGILSLATRAASFDGAALYPAAPGVALHALLMAQTAAADDALVTVGTALASLHRMPVPRGAGRSSPYGIEDWARWAKEHDQSCPSALIDGVLDVDRRLPVVDEPATLVHGDLHDKNVFVGRQCTLIDLASVRAGRPSEDVGMLAAHLVLRSLQSGSNPVDGWGGAEVLIDAYRRAEGPARHDAIRVEMARTLARLACLYRFRRHWHGITGALLEAARSGSLIGAAA